MKRPFETWILTVLLFVLSANAIYGGICLILQPDGSLLSTSAGWHKKMPFSNFVIPGILLLFFLGFLPVISLFGMFLKRKPGLPEAINCFPEKQWGWTFALYSGIIANIWIIVQQFIAGYFILQPVVAALGMLIIITALLPRIQRYYTKYPNYLQQKINKTL